MRFCSFTSERKWVYKTVKQQRGSKKLVGLYPKLRLALDALHVHVPRKLARKLTLKAVRVEQIFALFVTLDAALSATNSLSREAPK